jgi:hypothetical protein
MRAIHSSISQRCERAQASSGVRGKKLLLLIAVSQKQSGTRRLALVRRELEGAGATTQHMSLFAPFAPSSVRLSEERIGHMAPIRT